jgi:hypothetical protein
MELKEKRQSYKAAARARKSHDRKKHVFPTVAENYHWVRR